MDVALAVRGVSVTYTEIGVAGQAASALSEDFVVRGKNAEKDFTFKDTALTVDVEAWNGATITDSDSEIYVIREMEDSPGRIKFTATRPLERA